MSEGNSHFLMAVERIDGGMVVETADQALRDVIQAVQRSGKKGSVTLTLEISPNGEMGFEANAKVSAKAPQVQFAKSFFFMGRGGDLTREAPNMQQLGLMHPSKGTLTDG